MAALAPKQKDIEFRKRKSADGRRLLIILNHAHASREVAVGSIEGIDLNTRTQIAKVLTLPA